MPAIAIRADHLSKRYRRVLPSGNDRLSETMVNFGKLLLRAPLEWTRQKVKNVSLPGAMHFWALDNVSFDVKQGEVVGIIGRNGAGKSTLLKLLSRITEPSKGRVGLSGRVGSLLEVGTGFHPELTGRENVYLNGTFLGMRRCEIRRKFDEIIAFAEIDEFLDTPVKRYSSGMYVRLAFSVAAHVEPEILVLDEVLAVGDAEFQQKCMRKVTEITTRDGCTVLMVNHNQDDIRRLCQRVLWLEKGRLLFDGHADEGIAEYAAFAEGGAQPPEAMQRKPRAAPKAGGLLAVNPDDGFSSQPSENDNRFRGSQIKACRACGFAGLDLAIDLGTQPWGNHFLTADEVGREPYYPLRVVRCRDCQTAQLDYTVPKETMFGDHTYLSGMTRSLREHFENVARNVDACFFARTAAKSALDIGSNDGTQLRAFQRLGYDVLGVESSRTTARVANVSGIPTVNEFFNLELAQALGRKFHVINAAGVFFHLEELHSVSDGIRHCLADDGVFVVQFIYMKSVLENMAFDQIYHEHLLYYTLHTLQRLLARHGLELFDAAHSPIHGGSMIAYVTHAGGRQISSRLRDLMVQEVEAGSNDLSAYHSFARRVEKLKSENLARIEAWKRAGKSVFGYGAPVKGNTLLNYFGIDRGQLDCVVEINPLRKGLFTPGSHLPVLMEHELPAPPDVYYVLAWNFKSEILAKNRELLGRGVEFYFPIDPAEVAA